ncbi:MAG: SUMF1/EgtB/PvdO family nonheme iron enzyme [Planctomycetota bacterium]|nr:SUMF1/EgtB/PvdO family nonheme iron enzyme [Planctomycetota bacterium]
MAGKDWQVQGQKYRFCPYTHGQPGQPPWRKGSEGFAYPLLDSNGSAAAYLKFFTLPTPKRFQRTQWLILQQMHLWAAQLQAAPSLWVDSRQHSRPDAIGFDFTGCLARAVPGLTWLELKQGIQKGDVRLDDDFRWRCVCDLLVSAALLERAQIIHGDLSHMNIIVNPNAPRDEPALYLIDFDAFVARAVQGVTFGEGGTYGTEGYCPPDLARRAEQGDDSVLPYSDRFGRDMLALELLCLGRDHSPDESPVKWDKAVLRRRWDARLARLPASHAQALQALQPPHVFAVTEPQRVSAAQLVALGLTQPPSAPPVQSPATPRPVPTPSPDAFTGTRAGQERDNNGLQLKLCWCPAGSFTMGSPTGERNRGSGEGPVPVTLSQGFWLGKYEVTQGQWRTIMGSNPSCFSASGSDSSQVQGMATDRLPVENISWSDADAFCRKVTDQERQAGRLPAGWEYRLPTEAQWEYGCRAGTVTATAFGDKLSSSQANFEGNNPYNGANKGPYLTRTAKVGSYAGNAWGLQDMHGNVWEWCRDWYQARLPGGTDPEVSSRATFRVLRGGGWVSDGRSCRSALRFRVLPHVRGEDYGFRVAIVRSGF